MRSLRLMKLVVATLAVGVMAIGLEPASASSANMSHSYQSSGPISTGSIVSLDSTKSNSIVLANSDNGQRLLGVAVSSNDSLLAVDATQGLVQVATTGMVSTLVSDINGPIKAGDQIAVSPLSGIGMKANSGEYVIGLAESDFNSSSSLAQSQDITDTAGHTTKVAIGSVELNIAVGLSGQIGGGQENLNSLQRAAKSLTGHSVSTLRVIISLVVAIVALAALITLIYASIFGSIISVGRNPLAKLAVFRTLSSVMGMALLIAAVAAIVIILLIR